jgi:DNA-binding transcriptional MocR family regulator
MDAEISRALGELERKLQELQRTLGSVGGPDRAPSGREPYPPEPYPPEPYPRESYQPEPYAPEPHPRESYPPEPYAPDPYPPEPYPRESYPPEPYPPEPYAHPRLIDEAREVEVRHVSARDAMRHEPAPPSFEAHDRRTSELPLPLPRPRVRAARAAPAAATMPAARVERQAPQTAAPTVTTELEGFRDRLARTDPELAEDYQALLGRLSYSAVPTTPRRPSAPAAAPAPSSGPISFARGAPSLDIVDVDGLRDAAVRAFESDPQGTTAYGTSVGYQRLRTWIADRHGVEPERVIVTNGSMQADEFLFEHLVRPGDEVIVERPTYDRTLLSLRQRGARVQAIELEEDGIDTAELADLLEGGAVPRLAHIIPNFQNPAGHTLSLAKREVLLELAEEYGFVVFEDDPYVALRFSGESLPTMLSMDADRVVYASSFSKTVCPGIRVGYLVGPPDLIKAVAQLATGAYISPNMVAQSIVYEFCASGAIDRSIETVRQALAERAGTLANALRRDLPEAEFSLPQGGYFMWVTLPEGTDVAALHEAAAEGGVAFVKGTDFLLSGGENTLRLAYSGVTPRQIEEGIARLAEAYRSL